MADDTIVWKATNTAGDTCHFGVKSTAKVWAKGGSVEAIAVIQRGAYLRVVKASKKRPKPTPVHEPAHVEAWLYEVRFNGTGKNPPTDWQRYDVYTSRADAERRMAVCGGELEGRVTPLVRAAARAARNR